MQDALQSGAGSQIQKRLVLGAEFDPFQEYALRTIHFLPSNIHHHFAREPLTQPYREEWGGQHTDIFGAGAGEITEIIIRSTTFANAVARLDHAGLSFAPVDTQGRSRCCRKPAPSANARNTAGCRTVPTRTPASAPLTSRAGIRRPEFLWKKPLPKFETSSTRSATRAPSVRPKGNRMERVSCHNRRKFDDGITPRRLSSPHALGAQRATASRRSMPRD
jgi:hypothetical protein